MSDFPKNLQRYKCHKVVHAARIFAIMHGGEGWSLLIDDKNDARMSIGVDASWIEKHDPEPGGYYVRYKDGYSSYSPAEAFEKGYSEMAETAVEVP